MWSWNRSRRKAEAGSSTVLVVAFLVVIMSAAIIVLQLAWTLAWQERVQASADLAAVSGAQILADTGDGGSACAAAKKVAPDVTVECSVSADRVDIVASVEPRFAWITGEITAEAAAEPAW